MTNLVDRLTNIAAHLEQLDSDSGEAKTIREAITVLTAEASSIFIEDVMFGYRKKFYERRGVYVTFDYDSMKAGIDLAMAHQRAKE